MSRNKYKVFIPPNRLSKVKHNWPSSLLHHQTERQLYTCAQLGKVQGTKPELLHEIKSSKFNCMASPPFTCSFHPLGTTNCINVLTLHIMILFTLLERVLNRHIFEIVVAHVFFLSLLIILFLPQYQIMRWCFWLPWQLYTWPWSVSHSVSESPPL